MNGKIDIVYLWCDGNDPAFFKRKREYQALEGRMLSEWQGGENRFADNDELKYSLRSLEQYAPWINHVYIVTDRQRPKWLNVEYEKVTIVDHSEIMPAELIPCFNSAVIELFIPFINGLSETFLYANDDMFFGNNVNEEDFFIGGKPIVRVIERNRYKNITNFCEQKHKMKTTNPNNIYLIDTYELLYERYKKYHPFVLHHNIDAYTKSSFKRILETYKVPFRDRLKNRFRNENDVARIIFGLDAIYNNEAHLRLVKDPNILLRYMPNIFSCQWDSYRGTEDAKTRSRIKKFRPKLFCINAREDGDLIEKELTKKFYDSYFPNPSMFERKD